MTMYTPKSRYDEMKTHNQYERKEKNERENAQPDAVTADKSETNTQLTELAFGVLILICILLAGNKFS